MKLGLISDVHEHVAPLRTALDRFDDQRVDQVVVLGDVFETGERIEETVQLLSQADAVGVWGNHDIGLCSDPEPRVQERYAQPVVDYMANLRPRLEIDGCLFTHVEPWLDPKDPVQIWNFDGRPDTCEKVARSFDAAENRVIFIGHFHCWQIATPSRILDWRGDRAIRLAPDQRHLVVVAALCQGYSAIFNTETLELVPYKSDAA